MDVLEVVHLEERFGRHLPVARHHFALARHRAQAGSLQLGEFACNRTEPLAERHRIGVLVDEDPAVPHLAADRGQTALILVEADEVAFVGNRDETTAVDVVRPRVVLAAQQLRRALRFAHHRSAAVLARVVERANHLVAAANQDHGRSEIVEGDEVADMGNVVHASGDHPHLGPQVFALEVPEFVAREALDGNVGKLGESVGRCGSRELVAHLLGEPGDEFGCHQRASDPASTTKVSALTQAARSDARNTMARAMSSGTPPRPSGVFDNMAPTSTPAAFSGAN